MRKLIRDIHEGKNLEKNLPAYRDQVVRVYSDYAALELTFSAYILVEEQQEEQHNLAAGEASALERVTQALGDLGGARASYGEIQESMERLREDIASKMDFFTAYTDRLICYEYVLNRLELKYIPAKELDRELAGFNEDAVSFRHGRPERCPGQGAHGDRTDSCSYDEEQTV